LVYLAVLEHDLFLVRHTTLKKHEIEIQVRCLYAADGSLLRKEVIDDQSNVMATTDYLGRIEYRDGSLHSIHHGGGRIVKKLTNPPQANLNLSGVGSQSNNYTAFNINSQYNITGGATSYEAYNNIRLTDGFHASSNADFTGYIQPVGPSGPTEWVYEYDIADHLGNVRFTFIDNSGTPEIIQSQDYYPYGLKKNRSLPLHNSNPYQYNGIEHVEEHGLDLNMATYRSLDPAMAIWGQVDPKAESLYSMSPYQAMANNPIRFNDPEGDFIPAAVLGAGIGLVSNGLSNVANGQGFFDGAGKAALFGAIGGAASFGIGNVTSALSQTGANLTSMGVQNSLGAISSAVNIGSHAALGGLSSLANGGNFGSGALSGGLSAGIGLASGGSVIGGALGGGVGSVLGGGDFIQGVGQGLITGGLNHAAHSGFFGDNLAASLITGKTRHLFGPDAVTLTGGYSMGAGFATDAEIGGVLALRGSDAGQIAPIFDAAVGAGLDFSLSLKHSKFYYSGRASDFKLSFLGGVRYEANLSANFAVKFNRSASYGSINVGGTNQFVLGLGRSIGVSAIPLPVQGSLTKGVTIVRPR